MNEIILADLRRAMAAFQLRTIELLLRERPLEQKKVERIERVIELLDVSAR